PGPSCFTHTWTNVTIPHSVGGNTAYVGFTAASGSGGGFIPSSNLYVNSFVYNAGTAKSTATPTPNTPKPTPTPTVTPTVTPTATSIPTPDPSPTPGKKHPKKWHLWPA